MQKSSANKLILRLENLIKDVENIDTMTLKLRNVRLKPFFRTYNSCVDEFKSLFPEEYAKLSLEDLPLYDSQRKEQFTTFKISTLLHQSNDILAILRSLMTAKTAEPSYPNKVTLYWLARHVPVKLWVSLLILLLIAYLLGAFIGCPDWLDSLIQLLK